jgi:hypothetical protein
MVYLISLQLDSTTRSPFYDDFKELDFGCILFYFYFFLEHVGELCIVVLSTRKWEQMRQYKKGHHTQFNKHEHEHKLTHATHTAQDRKSNDHGSGATRPQHTYPMT